ncbi:MAG: amino acid permease [Spirochaetales bacterium]|uniref:Amino acid permease n=1 Tax=Candidatus Thalassospirochaeta sargassi TaxID=3119039 RepID=A0AAJ1IBG6_9SPIO|nr:amino acid permease [Spirochaetales bacterium]
MAGKFGTFKGVFVPSTEAILGTVLFLLMPLLTADVGFASMLAIVLIAHSVTLATTSSLSDCATNLNNIEGGGLYALSKQSLGSAMGGSIGIMLYLAQAASIGFYCIGFAEPLHSLIAPWLARTFDIFAASDPGSVLVQKQVLATCFMIVFFIIVMIGADFTLKLQILILFVLLASVLTIFAAPFIGPSYEGRAVFTTGLNISGNRTLTMGIFFLTFTQFFPAVTGISSGIGMSGDLKEPRKSIVKGTFSAIAMTMVFYILAALVFSFINKDILISGYENGIPAGVILTRLFGLGNRFPYNIPGVMILAGVLFATCSSALSVFMTGPRTLQFLARDGILPRQLGFLKNDFREDGTEPRYAVILSFFIGLLIIWMGSINFASMVVGILFLVVYGWVNGAAFLERISRNPTFRPTFRGHWLISLYGCSACIIAICLFNWLVGLAIFASQFIMFKLILKYKSSGRLEGVWWGFIFSQITRGLVRLKTIVQGTRNWRPVLTCIAFPEHENECRAVVELAEQIAAFQGLVNCDLLTGIQNEGFEERLSDLNSTVPVSFVKSANMTDSIITLLQGGNVTGIDNNTVLLAYNSRINNVRVIKAVLDDHQNLLLYKPGIPAAGRMRLDIWWRGERNGNLMVLLAFIINRYLRDRRLAPYNIRIIRRLEKDQNDSSAREEISRLLKLSRLEGEIIILPWSDDSFHEILADTSSGASMIMLGLPGNYENRATGVFKLNQLFFDREIKSYKDLPPVLFVKSYMVMNLIED